MKDGMSCDPLKRRTVSPLFERSRLRSPAKRGGPSRSTKFPFGVRTPPRVSRARTRGWKIGVYRPDLGRKKSGFRGRARVPQESLISECVLS